MATYSSSASAYCTATQLLNYYDVRLLGDYLGMAGQKLTRTEVLASTALVEFLNAASGEIEAACTIGKRYSPTDLAGLTNVSAAYLRRVVADLAFGLLVQSRPERKVPLPEQYKDAQAVLEKLRSGERIFGIQEAMDAGLIDYQVERAVDVEARNLSTTQASRYFGRRANRNDPVR